MFTRDYHSFRGKLIGAKLSRLELEIIGGIARVASGTDEFRADAGVCLYLTGIEVRNDSRIVEKFERTGYVSGKFSAYLSSD